MLLSRLRPPRLYSLQTQRRVLSAFVSPATETRHGADGYLFMEMDGGFRALQLKKTDGIPVLDSKSVLEISKYMEWWDENFMVHVAVLHGDGEHFCSGINPADLRVHQEDKARDCLDALCRLVANLGATKTPVISVLNGACAGSGYALAMGKYRFATEYSSFNVPEPTLGLGLAGGLSYTLPRLLAGNRPLALCLALTGMALEGPDLFFTQLATNYMTHRRLDMMMERLAEVNQDPRPFGDQTVDTSGDPSAIATLLERFSELSWNQDLLPPDVFNQTKGKLPVTPFVHDILPQIEQVFEVDSVEEAVTNLLERDERWTKIALQNIDRSSPLSLNVIFEQIRQGADMDLDNCLDQEFSVNTKLTGLPDFEMAMRARQSGKQPAWKSGSLEQVSGDQVASIFEPVPRPGEPLDHK